ncbi:hypothetical protein [Mycobacteroides chelonae]|uniref:hypothetical protein n=1 Tax=Mycobacteroides chelonae TaxID=1774 RepID=UPI0008A9C1F1|nr:hypothetical protein [Mycobacteroides chelonae]OHU29019.1 hypothetical protein BKG78_23385 [Mycobacteroides chelonae]
MTTFASDGTAEKPEHDPRTLAVNTWDKVESLVQNIDPETDESIRPDPEPEKGDQTAGETLPAVRASTDIAKPDQWQHDFLVFGSDKLEIRVPTPQAMTALSMGLGRFVPPKVQNDISGLFIAQHLSADSYGHVYTRLMNPDDADYNVNTIGELIGAILNTGVERLKETSGAAEVEAKK